MSLLSKALSTLARQPPLLTFAIKLEVLLVMILSLQDKEIRGFMEITDNV